MWGEGYCDGPRLARGAFALCRVVYGPFPPKVVLGPTFTSGWQHAGIDRKLSGPLAGLLPLRSHGTPVNGRDTQRVKRKVNRRCRPAPV